MATSRLPTTNNAPQMPKVKPPRKTAAEKRAEERAAREKAMADLEKQRPVLWLRIWVKALRLALIARDHANDDFVSGNSWWFEDFRVDPVKQTFRIETTGGHVDHAEATTHASDFERIESGLDAAFIWYQDYLDEKERKRLAELERQEHRRRGLEKLSPDEKKALNLA